MRRCGVILAHVCARSENARRTGTVLKKLPGEGSCRYEVCLGKEPFCQSGEFRLES